MITITAWFAGINCVLMFAMVCVIGWYIYTGSAYYERKKRVVKLRFDAEILMLSTIEISRRWNATPDLVKDIGVLRAAWQDSTVRSYVSTEAALRMMAIHEKVHPETLGNEHVVTALRAGLPAAALANAIQLFDLGVDVDQRSSIFSIITEDLLAAQRRVNRELRDLYNRRNK